MDLLRTIVLAVARVCGYDVDGPTIIGYTKAGRPIPAISGGDGTALATLSQDERKARLLALLTEVRDIAEKAENENRNLSGEDISSIKSRMDAAKELKAAIADAEGMADLKRQIADLGNGIGLDDSPKAHLPSGMAGKGRSVGDRFATSEAFKGLMGSFPNGQIPDSTKGIRSAPVGFGAMEELGLKVGRHGAKAVVTGAGATSGGALVFPEFLGLVDQGLFQRPLTILDLVTKGQTGSDTIDFVVEQGFTNAADVVAEATASSGTSGTKPESGFTLVEETANVRTIAHWIPATKRALSDAAQVRTLIDTFLLYGVEEKLEDEIVSGDGTGQHLTGVLHTTGVQSQAYSATVGGSVDGLLETTRKAITLVQTVGRTQPTAFVFSPNDWEKIEFARMKAAGINWNYGTSMTPQLHGLPVALNLGLDDGVGYVANWRYAVLWDREQAAIQVSDSHADFFIRNLVAFLAELRAAFGIFRPVAFCTIDLTP